MEPRFGADFGDVRVHTDAQATATATALGARAYTMGASIVFGPGEYAPGSPVGRRLLAHELAHVVQQRRDSGLVLQRAVRRGRDHGGHYAFDDEACTLTYHQDWFFTFETGQDEDERQDYMAAAREQVRDAWSGQFPLLPVDDDCACPGGVDVVVRLRTHEGERDGAHGYDVVVRHGVRAMVNPVIRRVLLSHDDDAKKHFGPLGGQGVIAHEFGHTIGRPDEYNTWARVLRTEGAADEPSIMHHGNQARLRHYQHFADLLSHELGGDCVFRPLGVRLPEHEIPARRMTGFPQPLSRLLHEQRLSNQALLGLMHPTAGAARVYDLRSGRFEAGPTVGGWLNRLRHPLFVDLHTGLLFAEDPSSSEVDVRVPVSANVGLRRGGYQFGAGYTLFADLARDWRDRHELGLGVEHRGEAVRVGVGYTAVLDELRGQGWSHLVGVGIDVDLDRLLP